jgi:hypothetical protein
MENEHDDALPLEVEAQMESDSKPELKRGMASLRGVKRSTYMRRSILRMLSMAPEERAAYSPRNGFEELSKAMLDAPKRGKEGAVVVAVFREVKECLGERIGSRWKDTQEHGQNQPTIINDMPSPFDKLAN